jgi:phage baseplate assembly protein W
MARSDKYTTLTNKPVYYADFANNLDLNKSTGFLAKFSNETSVKNSIKNLIFTRNGERFYQPSIGSKVSSLLFDLITEPTSIALKNTIMEAIENHEPRAKIQSIELYPDPDRNGYNIGIVFNIINIPEDIVLNFFLDRVR